ncbi:hypothetical protein TNCT_82001 [Trichonephila clavata]|uniref:Uncharacterized protein n=1 Tax=Trichonephila clavata TaxID=2740835 RepID=A0A8X6LPN8_TRICU|nr:hypothetical protein TNCT_82001 [Trichonephila clavata]
MDELDIALIMYLEDEQLSEEESRSEESELFKNRPSEGAFQILVHTWPRVSHSWISVILREVVEAIIKRMFPIPTMGQFQKIAQQYSTK